MLFQVQYLRNIDRINLLTNVCNEQGKSSIEKINKNENSFAFFTTFKRVDVNFNSGFNYHKNRNELRAN